MTTPGSPVQDSSHSASHGHGHAHSHGHTHGDGRVHDQPSGFISRFFANRGSDAQRASCCEMHSTNSSSEGSIIFALVGGVMVLTTVVAGWLGMDSDIRVVPAAVGAILLWIPLLMAAYREIQKGRPSSSVLVALAIGAALAIGEYVTAGALAFILFLMDAILRRTAWGAHRAIEQLVALTPDTARIVEDGLEREVDLADVRVGSVVRVRPGENLPADGTIITGRSTINQASLTGESAPVEAEQGSAVYAGTTNQTGVIDVEVTRIGADTTIGKVVTLINEAEQSRTPRQQIIEVVAGHYVYIVLMIAAAVFILSMDAMQATGEMTAVHRAIAVLVVTCPAALLLASPTAMVAAFAAAARLGIMIKNTAVFETAAGIDTVVLDKTGTITSGKFAVTRLAPAPGVDGAKLLAAAATAEQHSNHPLALAIMETARAARVQLNGGTEAEEMHGLGVKVGTDEGDLYVGRAKWLTRLNAAIGEEVAAIESRIEGMTGVHVMQGGRYLGAVGLEDKVRPNAAGAIQRMRDLGVRLVYMFTGDREAVAQRVAAAVGIDHIEAECHPEEKHARIVELTASGRRVMMVGDGINDGPSLAAADVGVAMGLGGTDIAANSAGIALMNDDLTRLPFLLELSRKTRMIVTQNIVAAILIALVGLVLAASGRLGEHMILIAAFYHFVGDIFVIGNSFRLVRYGEEHDRAEVPAAAPALGPATAPAAVPVAPQPAGPRPAVAG